MRMSLHSPIMHANHFRPISCAQFPWQRLHESTERSWDNYGGRGCWRRGDRDCQYEVGHTHKDTHVCVINICYKIALHFQSWRSAMDLSEREACSESTGISNTFQFPWWQQRNDMFFSNRGENVAVSLVAALFSAWIIIWIRGSLTPLTPACKPVPETHTHMHIRTHTHTETRANTHSQSEERKAALRSNMLNTL